jgi:NADH-quinone oxidoreductase subunit D
VGEALRVLVGSLASGALASVDPAGPPQGTVLLDLGPDHPSNADLIELRLWADGGVIRSARVVVGAMHRGAEKLFEVRDYRQILSLADRHDWQAPFSGELMVALACEQLMGLSVPDRASWLRTLLAEHTRILSHLGLLGYLPWRRGIDLGLSGLREELRRQTFRLSGNRVHPMINRIGGLATDADPGWLLAEHATMDRVLVAADRLRGLAGEEGAGVAVLTEETIHQYGVSGPTARASGVDLDLRIQQPYLVYAELGEVLGPPTPGAGDAAGRLDLLAAELATSARLVQACAERLADVDGPVSVRLGKIIRLPEGEAYVAVEAPLGIAGVFVVSRGEKTPWRLKLRTPSFNNVSALEALLVGVPTDRLELTLASIGYVVGDIDK